MDNPTMLTESDSTTAEKALVRATIDQWKPRLLALSHDIHAHPETAYEEHHAAAAVAEILESAGFSVTRGAYGLETAVDAVYGDGDFTVTLCAEYDALPGLGHACGHNLIATAGVGAALALAAVADAAGIRVKLLGTPAEEGGAGKVIMLERGAWDDATISMMVHGSAMADIRCEDFPSQAVEVVEVTYTGRAAHAAGAPHQGVNAADAATIAQVSLGLLRQQLPPNARVASIIEHAGDKTNVIPDRATVRIEMRSPHLSELVDLRARVLRCFEAGAVATGCEWSHRAAQHAYAEVLQNPVLAEAWNASMTEIGRTPIQLPPGVSFGAASTDMGNVSQVVPSIHPTIAILGSSSFPHTPDYTTAAASPEADDAALDGALALALTALSIANDEAARSALVSAGADRSIAGRSA